MSQNNEALKETHFQLPGQQSFYRGKVRDVYEAENLLIMVASDRISAFDHILPRPIPHKGQVLNQIANFFLKATREFVPNWVLDSPDPNVTIGYKCDPIRVEMVIRGYLTGHAWRVYKAGGRNLCGVDLPDGMKEHDPFPTPIITPATKAEEGHDEDISREDILKQEIVSEADYIQMEKYTLKLFEVGTKMAAARGLILVDTKYEFGKRNGEILLMDEVHTPDSSRYFYKEGYEERQANGSGQQQLSKEFVREWLMEHGFQGKENQLMPDMPDAFVEIVSNRYIELYEILTGEKFQRHSDGNIKDRIENNILEYLKNE